MTLHDVSLSDRDDAGKRPGGPASGGAPPRVLGRPRFRTGAARLRAARARACSLGAARLRGGALALALGLVAGCAERGLPIGAPVAAPAEAGAQGQAEVVIRAFLPGPGDARREVGGAVCEVRSILSRVRAVTPARVLLPGYGAQSPTLTVDCRAGTRAGRAVQAVATGWVRPPAAWGPGPWRPGPWGWDGWGPGPWGWDGPAYPVFFYPDMAVILGVPVDSPAGLGQSSGQN